LFASNIDCACTCIHNERHTHGVHKRGDFCSAA
jgi:hypothetical protein